MPPKRAVTASGDSQRKKRKTNETAAAPRMHPTVYDAVASRINYEGFIKASFQNEFKESRVRSGVMRPADEVLGRRRRAPEGIAPGGDNVLQKLPDHELLLAIHQYAADFYCANGMGPVSTRSMDETALIAIGLLLEETVGHLLGAGGHLALVDKRALELKDQGLVRDEDDEYYDEVEAPGESDEPEDQEGNDNGDDEDGDYESDHEDTG